MSLKKVILLTLLSITATQAQITLSLNKTISIAQHNDLWLIKNLYQQKSTEALSVAVGQLPDPKVSLAFLNYPTDTFNFGQEAMTQFKVGVSQMFPRGDSLTLKRQQLELKSDIFPFQRLDRSEKVKVLVSQLWLDAFNAQESIVLIEKNRSLFEQLSEVAESSYGSALVGRTNQQDIIRAQLELTRLEDKLTMLKQKYDNAIQKLSGWINDYYLESYQNYNVVAGINQSADIKLSDSLPDSVIKNPELLRSDDARILTHLNNHPAVVALQQKLSVSEKSIELAKQQYKPGWGVNASYGYRGESPQGINRADFLTLGITFDVPLFTKNRQDKKLKSAVAQNDAVATEELYLLRQMLASFKAAVSQLSALNERQKLFELTLLPQMNEQAEASLSAYTNDTGDFAEVVRSRIAELNAQIDALNIAVARQKIIAQLNYYFKQV